MKKLPLYSLLFILLPISTFSQTYSIDVYECKGEDITKSRGMTVQKFSTDNVVFYEINEIDSILNIKSFTRDGKYNDEFRIIQSKIKNGYKTYELSANVKPYKGNYGVEIMGTIIRFTALLENSVTVTTVSEITNISTIQKESKTIEVNESDEENCTFDLSTQTDEFLHNVDYFKGYVWNDFTKTATLILSTGEKLSIHKGGCDDYSVIAKVRLDYSANFYSIEHHFHYFYDIASQLHDDFMYDNVVTELKSENYDVMVYEDYSEITFKDQYLQDNGYFISQSIEDGSVVFSFGWRM